MKKPILAAIMIAFAISAVAQKANIKKVQRMLEYSSTPIQIDLSNLEEDKREEMKTLIEEAIKDPDTANDFKTWEYAGRLKVYEKTVIMQPYTANGNNFVDKDHMKRFFNNEADIVETYVKYFDLISTPNEKGKLPLKDDDFNMQKVLAQTIAGPSRANLYVGATQFVYDDPQFATRLLNLYYKSFEDKLFQDQDLKNTDPNYKDSKYVYATALKGAGGDQETILKLLNESLDSKNGPIACQDIITYYKEKNDEASELKYLKYAYEHYPSFLVFGIQYAERILQNSDDPERYPKTIEICDVLINRMKDGTIKPVDDNGDPVDDSNNYLVYYYKALSYFNTGKYMEAYNTFVQGNDACPGNVDLVCGAGRSAAKYANDNFNNKEVCNPMFNKAIEYFTLAENQWPDRSDLWGYSLYVCYNNIDNQVMKEKYKKYAEQ